MNKLIEEWAPQGAVLLGWPHAHTDWSYMLPEVTDCFRRIVMAISERAHVVIVAPDRSLVVDALGSHPWLHVYEMPTNDTWARDFGFITVGTGDGALMAYDFKFNGWGLKFAACYDNLINRELHRQGFFSPRCPLANELGFVLEGGAIETDGRGTLMTTSECLLSPNRNGNLTRQQISQRLTDMFGCPNVIWLDHGALEGDDTDSHIDTLARFVPGGVIACTTCDRPDDSHYGDLLLMREQLSEAVDIDGNPYRIIELPIPHAIHDQDGQRLPATYANFLLLNQSVLLPVYGDEHYDLLAIDRLSAALPDYKVVPIDCRALIQQHGSLHCVTMQIPHGAISPSVMPL